MTGIPRSSSTSACMPAAIATSTSCPLEAVEVSYPSARSTASIGSRKIGMSSAISTRGIRMTSARLRARRSPEPAAGTQLSGHTHMLHSRQLDRPPTLRFGLSSSGPCLARFSTPSLALDPVSCPELGTPAAVHALVSRPRAVHHHAGITRGLIQERGTQHTSGARCHWTAQALALSGGGAGSMPRPRQCDCVPPPNKCLHPPGDTRDGPSARRLHLRGRACPSVPMSGLPAPTSSSIIRHRRSPARAVRCFRQTPGTRTGSRSPRIAHSHPTTWRSPTPARGRAGTPGRYTPLHRNEHSPASGE
jgi:hypothetical protein